MGKSIKLIENDTLQEDPKDDCENLILCCDLIKMRVEQILTASDPKANSCFASFSKKERHDFFKELVQVVMITEGLLNKIHEPK